MINIITDQNSQPLEIEDFQKTAEATGLVIKLLIK